MTMDSLIPLVATLGWLVLVGSALVSHRLGWSRMVKLALVWLAIFAGIFLIVEWFQVARGTASPLL